MDSAGVSDTGLGGVEMSYLKKIQEAYKTYPLLSIKTEQGYTMAAVQADGRVMSYTNTVGEQDIIKLTTWLQSLVAEEQK